MIMQRTQAQYLLPGDVVGSGETVIQIIINSISFPSHKVKLTLQKDDRIRSVLWGKYTTIGYNRDGDLL